LTEQYLKKRTRTKKSWVKLNYWRVEMQKEKEDKNLKSRLLVFLEPLENK